MTPQQKHLMNFIERYDAKNGIVPSYEEMKSAVNLKTKSGVSRLINELVAQNYLTKGYKGQARSIRIVLHKCPHCGENLNA